jgi:hypothetical protein
MGPTFAIGIENPVAIDDFVVLVFEQRKIEFSIETFLHHLRELLRVLMSVDADGEDLHLFFLLLRQ